MGGTASDVWGVDGVSSGIAMLWVVQQVMCGGRWCVIWYHDAVGDTASDVWG